jgi:hypothetical protein
VVTVSGPLFDDPGLTEDFLSSATEAVAQAALVAVQGNLNASIRHPTPYYETQVRVHPIPAGHQVDDRGVIYGPWLEGTGSRNRTTRFKGYAAFRRALQSVERRVNVIIASKVDEYVGRLNR